ncbi:Murein DD-endopeptidase MepM and murein hydrolase activator NlpD, contain LysM domain [Paenibacillus sp. 1_12]|uniref:M23 family metallopeptidase n=1 Tax=Paenibacillus sp. 1_12 TaxID=1566278 RepID=UPI0008EAFB89|nr:M23 family metallopeptidase [Paenibacillus sp. 1_12]SFL31868.1 Murein DD-endopeptidase MepM and murein hydrolase activator NlpD, contain LysM domain [Paenibacillus sp. 1_12]
MDYTTKFSKCRWLLVGCAVIGMVILLAGCLLHPHPNRQGSVPRNEELYSMDQHSIDDFINAEAEQLEIYEQERQLAASKRGVQIKIDGSLLGIVKDEEAASALLDQYKQIRLAPVSAPNSDVTNSGSASSKSKVRILTASIGKDQTTEQPGFIQYAEFVQHIELVKVDIEPEDIEDNEVLLDKIATGGVKPFIYTVVRGDCISCLAYKFKIDKQVIYNNNPQIRNDLIRIGEKLDLSVSQPMLTLKTVEQRINEVEVPFTTEYIEDNSLKAGIQEILSAGIPGLLQVAMNTTRIDGEFIEETEVEQKLIRSATKAIVKKGTMIVAGMGTGQFAWPVYRAKLTSDYGSRWGSFHPGMDMVSEQSGIVASDHGVVIFAGWKTGYGNCIIIDHHNGYSTLYGHLSKISVAVDDRIEKGDKIGIMGSTGNATGVHLHFEIRKGEVQENPMKYLGKAS